MLEYEKFQEQQAKMMKMQEEYDRQLQEMEEAKEHALEELTEYYETKIQEMTTKLEQVGYIYTEEWIYYSRLHLDCTVIYVLSSQRWVKGLNCSQISLPMERQVFTLDCLEMLVFSLNSCQFSLLSVRQVFILNCPQISIPGQRQVLGLSFRQVYFLPASCNLLIIFANSLDPDQE